MKNILEQARKKADQAEVFCLRERSVPVSFQRGNLHNIHKKETTGIALRLIKDGRLGFATTSSPTDTGVIDRALAVAAFGNKTKINFPCTEPPRVECHDSRVALLTEEDLITRAQDLIDRLAAFDDAIACNVSLSALETEVAIMNTAGLDTGYKKTNFSTAVMTYSPQGFLEVFKVHSSSRNFHFPESWLVTLVLRHHQSRSRLPVPTKKMPVILSPRTFGALLYRLLAGINGANLNKGVSPLQDKLEQKIFDEKLSISENPHRPWGIFTCPVDDEGVTTRPKDIITGGILKSFLYDLEEGAKAGKESTGNGFKRGLFDASITDKPSPYATNLVLPPGTTPLERLISSLDEGLFVDSVMGAHTGNIPAGEFSLNISTGYYIQNGQVQGKAVDTMIAGNIYETLLNIADFSSEVELLWLFGPLGYGPYVLLPSVSVTGKK